MFDASSDALVDVAPIHFKSAAGDHLYAGDRSKPCRIHLFGPGSEAFAVVEQRQAERAIKRAQENDGKIAVAPLDEREAQQAQDLADLTSHFENFGYQGQELTRDRFKAFFLDKKMVHFHTQVTKALKDVGNWKPGGSATAGNS